MKLKSVTVKNFRCYRTPMTMTFDDLTVIVGRNDVGKSAFLDALDVFFNEKSLDKADASRGGDQRGVSITCVFDDLPDELVLDETALRKVCKTFLPDCRDGTIAT
ncbi:AAA family ATPase [Ralstonia mannitolilytica]|uniref:AAA family ATPase n=1 Tax=Ralstonia mannitolilytica TaxID=105219 RepID=UPI00292FB941|nr:AAA family ATPase [Ralstonia mannitolilytica]